MKQILIRKGRPVLADAPRPAVEPGSFRMVLYRVNAGYIPREIRLSVRGSSRRTLIEDFRRLAMNASRRSVWRGRVPDKGHRDALEAFLRAVRGEDRLPIDYESLDRTSRLAIRLARLVGQGSREA